LKGQRANKYVQKQKKVFEKRRFYDSFGWGALAALKEYHS
jgi:hypothetical protein